MIHFIFKDGQIVWFTTLPAEVSQYNRAGGFEVESHHKDSEKAGELINHYHENGLTGYTPYHLAAQGN